MAYSYCWQPDKKDSFISVGLFWLTRYGNYLFVNLNSTFISPCVANMFSEYNQQDATFLKFIYFCKMLYMFQTVFLSIIRSTKLHIQRQAFVRPLLLTRLAAGSSNGLTLYVQF